MAHFQGASFGPVINQHDGQQQIQLAAALSFDSGETALNIYNTPEYRTARAAGGMANGEGHVVNRTICAVTI